MTQCLENLRDPVCQRELEAIAASDLNWDIFRNRTVLVTGATGLVGSYAVRALAAINRIHRCGMHILALVRSPEKARTLYGTLLDRGDLSLLVGDVRNPIQCDTPVHFTSMAPVSPLLKRWSTVLWKLFLLPSVAPRIFSSSLSSRRFLLWCISLPWRCTAPRIPVWIA